MSYIGILPGQWGRCWLWQSIDISHALKVLNRRTHYSQEHRPRSGTIYFHVLYAIWTIALCKPMKERNQWAVQVATNLIYAIHPSNVYELSVWALRVPVHYECQGGVNWIHEFALHHFHAGSLNKYQTTRLRRRFLSGVSISHDVPIETRATNYLALTGEVEPEGLLESTVGTLVVRVPCVKLKFPFMLVEPW